MNQNMTPLEETLKPHRLVVKRRYLLVALVAWVLAVLAATAMYRATGLGPYAMAAVFVVFALWFFVRNELKYEDRYIMPDHWYATVVGTKGIRKQTLDDLKELISNTTPVTLDDVERIARRDAEGHGIAVNKSRPGVKALLARR